MAHVHYKFSSKLSYDTLVFDGPHTTLSELKREIMCKEKLRAGNCDLHITNAQTKEEYTVEDDVIPKGSSVIVRRIPIIGARPSSKSKANNIERSDVQLPRASGANRAMDDQNSTLSLFSKMTNLADVDVPEEDKLKVMMSQSVCDSMNLTKKPGNLPESYTCYRCGLSGHHIRNCPTIGQNPSAETPVKIKKSTGIPRSFMVEVDDPGMKGAMLTSCGRYAIPVIDAEAYAIGKKEKPLFSVQESESEEDPIPDELLCLICRDLLCDSVVIPCCGNSYCDDCIRTALLDSEDHVCPTCGQSDVSPDTLIANKFLRQAVNTFKKERGDASRKQPAMSQSQNLNPTPKPVPTLPPLIRHGRQQRPRRSQLRQQDSLQVHPEAAKTPPLSQVSLDRPTATCPVSAHCTASLSSQSVHDSQEIAVKEDSPSSHNSNKDQITSPSQLTPPVSKVNSSSMAERLQAISMDQEMPSGSSGHSKPSTSLDNSSASAGCATGNRNESIKQQQQQQQQQPPPSPFPLSVFHTNLPPPGYPAATPIWTPAILQGSPITSLCSSAPAVHKEWYGHQRKERPSHRTSRNRCSSSHSKSKPSQSFSHSSSRSESRSRSRSKDRSRHRSNSHRREHYSRSSSSYTFGYKRSHSPTPSSSSSPRSGYQSKSHRDHRRSRHDSKSSSSSSRRRADRSRRDPAGTHLKAEQKKQSSSSSLELDRERYMQWKKEYTEWCEKYLSSYVSHFHQLPFAPLLGPPPACPQWEEKEETNHSQASSSHHQTQGRHAARRDGRSPSSDSSSCSSSSPSHSSSENHSTPFQSPSQSSLSHKNSSCHSPPSQSSSDGLSAQSEDRNQTRTHESSTNNNGDLPVTHMKRTERVDDRTPTWKSAEESDLLNHEQRETKAQEVERRERSSSAAAADSKAESQDNKSLKTEIPISGRDVSNTRDALESIQQLPTPDESPDKNHERKAKEENNLEKEKVKRTDKDSQSGRVEDLQHSVKPSEEADLVATERKESSQSRRGHDTSSTRNRRWTDREGNDSERSPAVKHQSSKCHKTKASQDPESRRSESPKPLERKKQKKERTLLWTKADIWEKGIKVKPQKKINININLDVKRKEESIDQQDLSNLESIKEKTQENTEHVFIEEETFSQAQTEAKANGKTETGREEKTEETIKPEEAMWDQTFFTHASIEMLNEPMFEDEKEDLSLWHCALKSAEEMDDMTETETVSISHQDQVMEELTSSLQKEEENPFKKNGDETTMGETNAFGKDSNTLTPQTSKDEIQHEQLTTADCNVNPAVDRCGAEESQERRSLPEKSQGRAADGQNEPVLMQAFCSKWERKEEEEQDEGEVGVHTDTPPVALSQPAPTVNIRPTETGDGQQEQRSAEMGRDQDTVTAMRKEQEAQRHCNLSASKRGVSPSRGKDQTSSPLHSHRDSERDHNRDRERRTEEERKTSKEHKREKEKVRSRDREVERSSASSAQKRKHSSSRSSTSHSRERGASHWSSSSVTSRHSSTGRRSADLPDHNTKKSLRDTSPAWKSSHQDPSRTYRQQPRSAGTRHSSPPVSHRHSKDRDLLPPQSSAESADWGWMQSKSRNESKSEKKEREPNKVDKTKTDSKSKRDHRDVSERERVRKREEDVFHQRDGTTNVGKR